jgi:transcriptional regulator with XRE-family HTH domain
VVWEEKTMQEIRIASVIARERRKLGWTQADVARHLGVTKAAVSKWETGQSYPDAMLLPRLAALFAISLDELMSYTPHLSKKDIRKLYHKLAADFSAQSFDEVLAACRLSCKQHYACFELLYNMGLLLINHHMLADDPQASADIIREAMALFIRVKTYSEDEALVEQAQSMEAVCLLMLGQPQAVVELLGQSEPALLSPETLLAAACRMTGDNARASRVLQISMYRHVFSLLDSMTAYLELSAQNPARFDETLKRATALILNFDLKRLNPGKLFNFYLAAALGQMALGRREQTLEALKEYTTLATSDIYPLKLHGDAFFDEVAAWLEALPLGNLAPRGEPNIRRDLTRAVAEQPAFAPLLDDPRCQRMLRKLKENEDR